MRSNYRFNKSPSARARASPGARAAHGGDFIASATTAGRLCKRSLYILLPAPKCEKIHKLFLPTFGGGVKHRRGLKARFAG